MTALVRDLRVEQGSDFAHEFDATDDRGKPLIGWQARAAIRHRAAADLLYAPEVALLMGTATLLIPGAVSGAWTWRQAHYEIKLFGPRGEQRRLAHGRLTVDPQYVH